MLSRWCFQFFLLSPQDSHFDYFSDGLKPPTSYTCIYILCTSLSLSLFLYRYGFMTKIYCRDLSVVQSFDSYIIFSIDSIHNVFLLETCMQLHTNIYYV